MTEFQNIDAAPDWLRDECLNFLKRLGLGDWRVQVFICDMPQQGDRVMFGEAHPDSAYLQGALYFNRDITPEQKNHIYHECLHFAFADLEHTIDNHIIGALSQGLDGFYQGLYMWHFERLIERVARAFAEKDK